MYKKISVFLCSLAFAPIAAAGNSSDWTSSLDSAFQPSLVAGFEDGSTQPIDQSNLASFDSASQRREEGWRWTASLKGHEQFGTRGDFHPSSSEKADYRAIRENQDTFGLAGMDLRGLRIGARIRF